MTGISQPAQDGNPAPAGPGTDTGTAAPARRHRVGPVTGRPQKPCSRPPKRRTAAYDRRPGAGPGRTPRRTQRQSAETRQVRVELPDELPPLTPEAARVLLRILLKARADRNDEQAAAPGGQEGRCP
jgi:hypothetical protein